MEGLDVRTPWHLWVVGVLSLVWNFFCVWDYTQTQLKNRDYIAAMTEPMGIPIDQALAYYESFPAWMDAAWALGVWGAVLGSVLLLLRSRLAVISFIASLFGLLVGTVHGIADPMPGVGHTAMTIGFSIVLWLIALALIFYSRQMAKHSHLR